jgi:CHAT domain-containing protein
VERHTIQVIPGVGYWLERVGRSTGDRSRLLLGVGDPIYNGADPRIRRRSTGPEWSFPLRLNAAPREGGLDLPRLVGSGAELDACARAWSGESVLLKGGEASRRNLLSQLRRKPAIVHLATHVLGTSVAESRAMEGRVAGSADRSAYGMIALSLTGPSEPELLPPMEIARWKIEAGLVVLSGCGSAGGTVLQGTGLMGLTRAWLAAGARSVVGSRWATPDEDGGLFRSFYRSLNDPGQGPAQALRASQLEMIRSGGWRAKPRYWGAYFMLGNL